MAGLIEWWMSRPFYDDPAKHGWGFALFKIVMNPLMWFMLPLFLIWGVFIWLPRSIWNLFKGDVDDYQGGIADQGSRVDDPAIGYEVVSEVYIPTGTRRGRPEGEWWGSGVDRRGRVSLITWAPREEVTISEGAGASASFDAEHRARRERAAASLICT